MSIGTGGGTEGVHEFGTSVGSEDFVEPGLLRGLVFAGEDFDHIAVFEFFIKIAHLAVDFDANNVIADFGMKAIGKIEREGTLREVDDVALGGVDEDFVGEEVELELLKVNLLPFA